jgi:hypothetical protein
LDRTKVGQSLEERLVQVFGTWKGGARIVEGGRAHHLILRGEL